MARHIGIVACSAEGAALCYRTICAEAPALMGEHRHPEVSMHTFPLATYMVHIREGNWEGVAELMIASVQKLAGMGADFAISPDNTIHQAFDRVLSRSLLPWLHIGRAVAEAAIKTGFKKLGIMGTKYLMIGPVYPDVLKDFHLAWQIPEEDDRKRIDTIIMKELVNGIFRVQSRLYFNQVIQGFREQGCDAVVLGCTEIPLLVDPKDCPLPVLDSTRLLARSALAEALRQC